MRYWTVSNDLIRQVNLLLCNHLVLPLLAYHMPVGRLNMRLNQGSLVKGWLITICYLAMYNQHQGRSQDFAEGGQGK